MTTAAPMPVPFPFAAITGQPQLRQALLLAAVDPGLGGVLIEGPRGTAKTTAARALAELLPGAPFITLPLGASLESLVGTLDLGQALAGHELKFAPGLLARANGGVLYVDEINLLPDALIDSLLDAAASGVNVVERDGISHRHAARFVLVGTMNPEEGTLRPQLLDRFGLCVQLRNIEDAAERQAIVRARLAFDADPQGFRAKHAQTETELAAALVAARAIVADGSALPYGDDVHEAVSTLCISSQVDGLRADLVMLRSARALAAWDGAAAITADHVQRVAEAVLLHRRKPELEGAAPAQAPASRNTGSQADATGTGQGKAGDGDWGALPLEPIGIERVKPLRPLIPSQTAQQATPKKA